MLISYLQALMSISSFFGRWGQVSVLCMYLVGMVKPSDSDGGNACRR